MLKTQNIGPGHPMFNKDVHPGFTQVLVHNDDELQQTIVAQFYGVFAKRLAALFVQKFNEFSPEKIDQKSNDLPYSQLDLVNFNGIPRPITPN